MIERDDAVAWENENLPGVDSGRWREVTLGDVVTLQRGFDLPETERQIGPHPVIASTGPVGTHHTAAVKGPGVVIGRSGSLGGGQFIESDFWPLNTTLWVKDFHENDRRFCYYLLKSLNLADFNAGSGVPTLNRNHIHPLPVKVPGVPEQQAIAHILGSLDDKIKLNQRMNQTLEEMARALFKSWFVDFDPVRAKIEGYWRRGESLSGLPPCLYDLFPDRLVGSELGEIPEGWEIRGLGEILQQRNERCRPSAATKAIPYVPIDCISPRNLFLTRSKSGEEAQSSLTRFRKDDLLFGAMRPYFHKVCIAPFDGTTRTTAFVLYPKSYYDQSFGTFLLHDPNTIDFATRNSTGSTIPYAVWTKSLELMPVVVPSTEIRKAFHAIVRPILSRIPKTYFENRSLTELRDALLPRLLSGEIQVGVH